MIRLGSVIVAVLLLPMASFAFAQYLDISQLESDKVTLQFGEKSYDLYYGYRGSLDSMGSDVHYPTLSSMEINEERKSLEITMEDVPETTDFWVRMPFDVITAENEKFTVIVDGVDTGYDLMKFPDGYVVGFIITEGVENIEIIGTAVIPEFGIIAVLILGISILGLIFLVQKSPFAGTRIN